MLKLDVQRPQRGTSDDDAEESKLTKGLIPSCLTPSIHPSIAALVEMKTSLDAMFISVDRLPRM